MSLRSVLLATFILLLYPEYAHAEIATATYLIGTAIAAIVAAGATVYATEEAKKAAELARAEEEARAAEERRKLFSRSESEIQRRARSSAQRFQPDAPQEQSILGGSQAKSQNTTILGS